MVVSPGSIPGMARENQMRTPVTLSDQDLATLAMSSDPKIQSAANAALNRLAAPSLWPNISPHAAALVADIITEAREQGRLIYRGVSVSHCRYCDARSEWKKPPRKKREREYMVPAVDVADRTIIISGHVSVGGCRACVEHALPVLRAELATFPVQLPTALRLNGAPVYQRWGRCRCKKCDWTGHEGQLGKLRTLMGDGDYPGVCPSCGAKRIPLGSNPFEYLDGFEIAESK